MHRAAQLDWYFDFISPFSFLQWHLLRAAPSPLLRQPKPIPVLFAGLLAHWHNVGPVEIAPKREWTYEHCLWIAHKNNIAMRLPAHHPFNPLPLLRLCIALGGSDEVVGRLFKYVWQEGLLPTDTQAWQSLLAELNTDSESLNAPEVKAQLLQYGQQAMTAGVFGVPTAVIDGKRFWGVDATDMLQAYVEGDPFFHTPAFQAAAHLPEGLQRKANQAS